MDVLHSIHKADTNKLVKFKKNNNNIQNSKNIYIHVTIKGMGFLLSLTVK